ncbi:MAG: hypothetical protein KDB00_12715, partial [Planctomycetales bacterium]|nr:hypothetical protein [Planctomycetales bacterium]
STLFENADVCLMALPPGLFYVQAPFFALFPAGYATARLPLFIAALATIAVVFWVVKRLGGSDPAAAAASLLVSLSRPLLFTGLTVRPDLLSALAGWLGVIAAWQLLRTNRDEYTHPTQRTAAPKSHNGQSVKLALASGALTGLAGLFHPFALVFAIQGGVAMLMAGKTVKEKVTQSCVFVCGNLMSIGLWVPLIVAYPYEFRSQFFANVLDRAGPGLPARLIWPFPSLIHHARLLYEFAGPFQCALMVAGFLVGSFLLWRANSIAPWERKAMIVLVWSSVYLTATVAGMHPTKGYWMYPFLWIVTIAVVAVDRWLKRVEESATKLPRWATGSIASFAFAIALLMMLPGAGLRTTWIYLTHWKQSSVYAPRFIEQVLDDLPTDGVYYVDLSYVFDVYLSGRETRLCQERHQYWGDQPLDYRYLLLSWEGDDANWADQYDGYHVKRIGDRSVPQNCFVDLYRPRNGIGFRPETHATDKSPVNHPPSDE